MSGVIGDACFGQCGFNLDNPFEYSMGDLFYVLFLFWISVSSIFCKGFNITNVYAQFLSKSFVSVQSIKNYISMNEIKVIISNINFMTNTIPYTIFEQSPVFVIYFPSRQIIR
jgi:hypothetical protein